ncbi:hypothetical protein BDV41DRAFT_535543 [Aspergillus transmontanensis]|uniref:Uncharacterized protein n=1 Tax=Aspergillus transmontanensis TaxID=1034304 RepID=A0A5N6VZ77_9EURO|nr:hypothetical protein BDV41DRAFT_535543 [Aspergillus transmontanensis]
MQRTRSSSAYWPLAVFFAMFARTLDGPTSMKRWMVLFRWIRSFCVSILAILVSLSVLYL